MLNRVEAAKRLGISVREFNRFQRLGYFPKGIRHSNPAIKHKVWSDHTIDVAKPLILKIKQVTKI